MVMTEHWRQWSVERLIWLQVVQIFNSLCVSFFCDQQTCLHILVIPSGFEILHCYLEALLTTDFLKHMRNVFALYHLAVQQQYNKAASECWNLSWAELEITKMETFFYI